MATPSEIGYVRKGCARGLTKLGVSYLPLLARPSPSARLWLHVSIGYGDPSLLPSGFPKDNIGDIILSEHQVPVSKWDLNIKSLGQSGT